MLDIEDRDGVAVLHLRGAGVNHLDAPLLRRLTAAVEFVRGSRAVVLTGYRTTFAIGAGIVHPLDEQLTAQRAALRSLTDHPGPVVAAVNGHALDAGFALAAAADVRLMANGLIGTTQPEHGLASLSAAAIEAIGRLAGPLADEMLREGRSLSVDDAASYGIIARRTRPTTLLDEAVELANVLSRSTQRV